MNQKISYKIELLKAVFVIPLCLVAAWFLCWMQNVGLFVVSISIGTVIEAILRFIVKLLIGERVIYYWGVFVELFLITAYSVIPLSVFWIVGNMMKSPWIAVGLCLLIGAIIFFLFDPSAKHYPPSGLSNLIDYMQNNLYFKIIGGPNLNEWTWTSTYSNIAYRWFDIYTVVLTLFFAKVSKDECGTH